MSRPFSPKIITANALIDGDVIYLTDSNTWSGDLQHARVFTDEDSANAHLSQAAAQTACAVGVYLVDIKLEDGVLVPTHFREAFRKTGPSNYAHGKQEQVTHV
jgi:hypothetical protein